MSQKRATDQQRIDQIAPRLAGAGGPAVTHRQRLRLLRMQLREAGQYASRNTGQRPFVINTPPSAGPPRTVARTFPTDGGQTPTQRLVVVANDIGERSLTAREEHTPGKEDFTRRFTGPIPPKPAVPRPDAPRPKP